MTLAAVADTAPPDVTFRVAGAPVPWARPRRSKSGFFFTVEHVRKYQEVLSYHASRAMEGRTPLIGPLAVTVTATIRIPTSWSQKKQGRAAMGLVAATKRPDADNYLKAALDACNEVVWRDDSQVVEMTCVKRYGLKPELAIDVRRINAEAA